MGDDKENSETVKKSVSMPSELWSFVAEEAGTYGEKSKVIQEAIRQMRDRMKDSGRSDLQKATKPVKYKAERPSKQRPGEE